MDFILGCNYWASNGGTEAWKNFDKEVVKKDISTLMAHGIRYLRVFPLWRDFQPIEPLIGPQGKICGYIQNGKSPENNYYLEEKMLKHFSDFLDICKENGIKVIVGLITGWMSGALFIPTALYGKNVITDPTAQYFEQLFIKGFVTRFKEREEIYAWDLGNECNGMSTTAERHAVASWTAMISNAIKAADPTRAVVSGMHGLKMTEGWTIKDQGEFCDILTTHPYPFWCEHTRIDTTLSYRTLLLPTAQSRYYSDISKRPCLAEEMGTMGPMICSDERSADFLRVNLFSLWANGICGSMWWCNSDQTSLNTFPYTHQMVERELGLIKESGEVKPTLLEYKKFSDFLAKVDTTPSAPESDAVCVLTRDQRHWGVAYMTYLLARRAGLNISFAYADEKLPDSDLYLLPSVNEFTIMPKSTFDDLKNRVKNGATLYISLGNAIISEFESLCGLKVIDSYELSRVVNTTLDSFSLSFKRDRNLITEPTSARVLAYDEENCPLLSENAYGKGRVYFLAAPVEDNLIDVHNAFEADIANLYSLIFRDKIQGSKLKISDTTLLANASYDGSYAFVTVVNCCDSEKDFSLTLDGYEFYECVYGDKNKVMPYDASVIKFIKK